MNIKLEFKTINEMDDFAKPYSEDPKYIVDKWKKDDETYVLQIQEQKFYAGYQEAKMYPDEVWYTEDGTMIQIQDLTGEHMRNIIRHIIRKERETKEAIRNMMAQVTETCTEDEIPPTRVLH
jgi:hypothetical protein